MKEHQGGGDEWMWIVLDILWLEALDIKDLTFGSGCIVSLGDESKETVNSNWL